MGQGRANFPYVIERTEDRQYARSLFEETKDIGVGKLCNSAVYKWNSLSIILPEGRHVEFVVGSRVHEISACRNLCYDSALERKEFFLMLNSYGPIVIFAVIAALFAPVTLWI